jgi:monofunctional glycosyltransferase
MRALLRWAISAFLAFYGLCTLSLFYLKFFNPLTTTVHIQRRIETFSEPNRYIKRYTFVPLSRITDDLERAAIAAEDGRFFQHHGIDWLELEKAISEGLRRGGRMRGASTITQQLVKNLFFPLHQTVIRKVLDMPLAVLTETMLSKERILELYLNVIEWGPGVYGAEEAARYHYGVSAAALNRNQAARLAACIPAPLSRIPQRMDGYSAEVLRRMDHLGW